MLMRITIYKKKILAVNIAADFCTVKYGTIVVAATANVFNL